MDQHYVDLLGAIARQAVHDVHSGYRHPRHMDAGAWLEAAGLLEHALTTGPVRRTRRTMKEQLADAARLHHLHSSGA